MVTDSVSRFHFMSDLELGLTSHVIGVDAKTGYIFCSECNDFIYDSKFQERHLVTILSAEEKLTKFKGAFTSRQFTLCAYHVHSLSQVTRSL